MFHWNKLYFLTTTSELLLPICSFLDSVYSWPTFACWKKKIPVFLDVLVIWLLALVFNMKSAFISPFVEFSFRWAWKKSYECRILSRTKQNLNLLIGITNLQIQGVINYLTVSLVVDHFQKIRNELLNLSEIDLF